jgi:hypothetical protein
MQFEFNVNTDRLTRSLEQLGKRLEHMDFDKLGRVGERIAERVKRGVKRFDFDRLTDLGGDIAEWTERSVDGLLDGRKSRFSSTHQHAQTVQLDIRGSRHHIRLELDRHDRLPAFAAHALGLYELDWNAIQAVLEQDLPDGVILEIETPELQVRLALKEKRI